VLWDVFHQIQYPPGYLPRDALDNKDEPFDWNGDHPHTNFKDLFNFLRAQGFFVELLGAPLTCFDASQYGALLLMDAEDEFFPSEIQKLKKDVLEEGLSVIIVADWYNTEVMKKLHFQDSSTKEWWAPVTGGANIPALNDLLHPFGIAFGDRVCDGEVNVGANLKMKISSGTSIAQFPKGGILLHTPLTDSTEEILFDSKHVTAPFPILGFYDAQKLHNGSSPSSSAASSVPQEKQEEYSGGRVIVFGDSSCFDEAAGDPVKCLPLMTLMLRHAMSGVLDPQLRVSPPLQSPYTSDVAPVPRRPSGYELDKHSRVLGRTDQCTASVFNIAEDRGEVEVTWKQPIMTGRGAASFFLEKSAQRNVPAVVAQASFPWLVPFLLITIVFLLAAVVLLLTRRNSNTPALGRRMFV